MGSDSPHWGSACVVLGWRGHVLLQYGRVLAKGASLTQVWVNKSASVFGPAMAISPAAVSQMKVESNVLASCALRARASNSCFIKADFSFSSWAMRSLFSVTS